MGAFGGKTVIGEPIEVTAQREIFEETGLKAESQDLQVINMFTTQSTPTAMFYQVGVLVKKYSGKPINKEPNACDELKCFDLDKLPDNLFLGTRGNIELYLKGEFYNRDVNYDCRNEMSN